MTVTNVISRMYDLSNASNQPAEQEVKTGFEDVLNTAVENEEVDKAVAPVCSDCSVTGASEVQKSAMVRFTMYVRISGDFGAMQNSLVEKFKSATKDFVTALKGDEKSEIVLLDGYLGKADEAAKSGLQSSKSFIDDMLAAADNGLRAVAASMTSSAWMSGLNSFATASSSSMISGSAIDIARLKLQDSLLNSAMSGSSGSCCDHAQEKNGSLTRVSYGSSYNLALVKSSSDLVIIPEEKSEAVLPGDTVDDSADVAATESSKQATALALRDAILDKFLQLLDDLSTNFDAGSRIVRAGFSFAYESQVSSETDAGVAVKPDTEVVVESEEIIA